MSYPKISIVTPSFNQAKYIRETIESVLSQGYPNLEYIIIDGGSTDGSVDIIREYARQLKYWVSEKDHGQTHAINKGMMHATGEIRAYLNSDDYYLSGAFDAVREQFLSDPETDLLHGHCRIVDEAGGKLGEHCGSIVHYDEIIDPWSVWWNRRQYVQPEVFWSKRIAERVGPFREDLHYVMDYEYWLRILKAGGKVNRVDRELTAFRRTPVQKSAHAQAVSDELLGVVRRELWDESAAISTPERERLQGEWLYQKVFCPEANLSVSRGDSLLRRWAQLSWLALRHPQLFRVPAFRRRALGSWSQRLWLAQN